MDCKRPLNISKSTEKSYEHLSSICLSPLHPILPKICRLKAFIKTNRKVITNLTFSRTTLETWIKTFRFWIVSTIVFLFLRPMRRLGSQPTNRRQRSKSTIACSLVLSRSRLFMKRSQTVGSQCAIIHILKGQLITRKLLTTNPLWTIFKSKTIKTCSKWNFWVLYWKPKVTFANKMLIQLW